MFNLRSVFASWAVVALFLGSGGRAHAQTLPAAVSVAVPTTGVRRANQDYAGKVLPTQINYKDCVNNDEFSFTVNLGAGFMGYSLELWAGNNCEGVANRNANTATCWQITQLVPSSINLTMKAKVQDMLYGLTGNHNIGNGTTGNTSGTGGTGGTDASGGTGASDATGDLGFAARCIFLVCPVVWIACIVAMRNIARDEASMLDRARLAGEPV